VPCLRRPVASRCHTLLCSPCSPCSGHCAAQAQGEAERHRSEAARHPGAGRPAPAAAPEPRLGGCRRSGGGDAVMRGHGHGSRPPLRPGSPVSARPCQRSFPKKYLREKNPEKNVKKVPETLELVGKCPVRLAFRYPVFRIRFKPPPFPTEAPFSEKEREKVAVTPFFCPLRGKQNEFAIFPSSLSPPLVCGVVEFVLAHLCLCATYKGAAVARAPPWPTEQR
jgi:hypothetical protein